VTHFSEKPWGRLDWILRHLEPRDWHVIGCLGTEERCFAALGRLAAAGQARRTTLINIAEPEGHPREREIRELKQAREQELSEAPFDQLQIEFSEHDLLEPYHRIVEATRASVEGSKHIVLDITALPKRFFFPMLKILLRQADIEDLLVTYSMAESYADGELHQDIQSPEYVPLFAPDLRGDNSGPESLVISIGFESSGVIQILEQSDYSPVSVLFSYPAPPPFFGRNWDFVRYADKTIPQGHLELHGVSVVDVPSVFDVLTNRLIDDDSLCVFAPYGPKPVSLAMCLYSAGRGAGKTAVMYTQPKYYNPQYSRGIGVDSQGQVIYAYPVILKGRNRYP
jgi:hypothetical protein